MQCSPWAVVGGVPAQAPAGTASRSRCRSEGGSCTRHARRALKAPPELKIETVPSKQRPAAPGEASGRNFSPHGGLETRDTAEIWIAKISVSQRDTAELLSTTQGKSTPLPHGRQGVRRPSAFQSSSPSPITVIEKSAQPSRCYGLLHRSLLLD